VIRIVVFLIALAAASCSRDDRIVIGSKNFTEQVILGELLAQAIERQTDVPVDRRLNLGGTLICHEALVAGQLDLYVEYTGTALTAILNQPVLNDAARVYDNVRAAYRDRFNAEWTEPLGFNNTFVMVIRESDAADFNIRSISDAAPYTRQWRAGFGYEFIERPDGFPGLAQLYNLQFAAPPRVMDLGLTYRALASGQVDMIAGNSTDGLIDSLRLFALEDDMNYFPPYDAVPVIRQDALDRRPEIRAVLARLAGTVSEEDMRRLNYQVDGEGRGVADVVREFLTVKGL
jgi:glycine betaine/choline ABC-type transport system substrate-binding protein